VNGRTLLIEQLPYLQISSQLSILPSPTATVTSTANATLYRTSSKRLLPPERMAKAMPHPTRISKVMQNKEPGVKFDYEFTITDSDETNFTFQGDVTYYVSGVLSLFGTTTIEGGTVIKYAYYGADASLVFYGPINCLTASYTPAIFTASDDNSIGEIISGSTGSPTPGSYGSPALDWQNASGSIRLHDLAVNYASIAMDLDSGESNIIRDVQFMDDDTPFSAYYSTNDLQNVLICNASTECFAGVNSSISSENLTADDCNYLWVNVYSSTLSLTNSLLIATPVGSYAFSSAYNVTNSSDSGIFQTVGGGSHYLATDAYRYAGTTNIDPVLLADLAQRTTHPPLLYESADISSLGTLTPQVQRDTNSLLDLGYHYAPLDYLFGGCALAGNLTVTAGTAIGWFIDNDPNGIPDGITLNDQANLSLNGTATQPCYYSEYNLVQESGGIDWFNNTDWYEGGIDFNGDGSSPLPQLSSVFTKWADYGWRCICGDNDASGASGVAYFENSEIYNGAMGIFSLQSISFTNCLIFRHNENFWNSPNLTYVNCTFYNGCLSMYRNSPVGWTIENSAFDGTTFAWSDSYNGTQYTYMDYNAYNTNNLSWTNYPYGASTPYGTNEVIGPNDVLVTSYNWQSSWFGDFYLSTNSSIIQMGSVPASELGLYWFTTQTNQVPETNAIVDIGYHYVATDTNGNPLATFGTNLPNYILYPDGAPPTIVIEPASQTVLQGTNVAFTVTAEGFPSLSYQWFWEGQPLSDDGGYFGSASAVLNLDGVQPDQAGGYYVVVTNDLGSVTSSIAMLNVTNQPSQTNYSYPPYILSPNAYWNITDISDPAQPVNIGELQAPYSEPGYNDGGNTVPPYNTLWHTNGSFGTPPIVITNGYGTTTYGGTNNLGTVFEIGFIGGGIANIHTFDGFDGAYPCSQLAISGSTYYGISNTLYGTTFKGGAYGYGTIFKVNSDGSGFTNLYDFTGSTNDGANPQTGMLINGNTLYGTTTNSIFKINTDGSDFSCLTNINGASQLILSLSGYLLYGTTTNGGASNKGMLFSINTDGADLTDLHDFTGGTNGAFPTCGLELLCCSNAFQNGVTTGTLYGTTYGGGMNNFGMLFSFNTGGSNFIDLHDFNSNNDGAYPIGGLFLTNNNTLWWRYPYLQATYLYGTTSSGGTNGGGTLFGMNLVGSVFQTLYSFGGTNGAHPEGKLISNFASQKLYGTTYNGGTTSNGIVFSINPDGSDFTTLHNFTNGSDGGFPSAGLALPVVDNLWSIWSLDTTINISPGSTNCIYSIAIDDSYVLFVNGNYVSNIGTDGQSYWRPYLILPYLHPGQNDVKVVISGNGDGNDYFAMRVRQLLPFPLFGTTWNGGSYGNGTVFETSGGNWDNILYSFGAVNNDGGNPIGDLVSSGSILYGITRDGGTNGVGTIFSIDSDGSNYMELYSFKSTPDGALPQAGLTLSGNTLYGTTSYGGSNSDGTIFRINTDGSGYTNLYSFGTINNDGLDSEAALLLISNSLYGTTPGGGAHGWGTIFRIATNGSNYQTFYSFNNSSTNGFGPSYAGLIVSNNIIYGTTEEGGGYGYGTVFKLEIDNTNYQQLYSFGTVSNDGEYPEAELLLVGNTLYGTTSFGGSSYGGTIYSIGINGANYTNLQSFNYLDEGGFGPQESDLLIQSNVLYGTTVQGGADGEGMVFSINTNGMSFGDIYDFSNNPDEGNYDGANPYGGLCSP
jgi:uncharacterized repeat protein (TIGR03803 family)